jgi:predicted NUDIX family NTP pyrophosphohydrolase
MTKSAGILLYRFMDRALEILLVHPGGPFWKNKDEGAWSIPKGEFSENEDPLPAAIREFEEETGTRLSGNFVALCSIKQKAGKLVYAWALNQDLDVSTIKSNSFEMEWPPKSGKKQSFPEVDRAQWFPVLAAKKKIIASQIPLIEELTTKIKV